MSQKETPFSSSNGLKMGFCLWNGRDQFTRDKGKGWLEVETRDPRRRIKQMAKIQGMDVMCDSIQRNCINSRGGRLL